MVVVEQLPFFIQITLGGNPSIIERSLKSESFVTIVKELFFEYSIFPHQLQIGVINF